MGIINLKKGISRRLWLLSVWWELIPVYDIDDHFNNEGYNGDVYKGYSPDNRKNKINKSTFFLISLIIIIPLFLFLNDSLLNINASDNSVIQSHSLLGPDTRGYVVKDVYANSNRLDPNTIAVITDISSRNSFHKRYNWFNQKIFPSIEYKHYILCY